MDKYDLSGVITISGEVKYQAKITSFVAAKVIALLSTIEAEGTEEVVAMSAPTESIEGKK